MAKFNFNLRNTNSENATPINLVIRWNNKKLVFPTKDSVVPKNWQPERAKGNYQRAIHTRKFPELNELNARLDDVESRAKTIYRRFINDNNRQPSTTELKNALKEEFEGVIKDKTNLIDFIEKFINESEKRLNDTTGKPIKPVTIRDYKRSLTLLKEFSSTTNKLIDFENIDLDFYNDYVEFLSHKKEFSNNTVGKHIKHLKTFLSYASEKGINTTNVFKSKRFKVIREKSDNIYLTEAELEEMYELDLSKSPKLEKVRDLFIVGCWTGLRFSDFSNIKAENIKGDMIEIETIKTNNVVNIPIHPTVRGIMNKYKDDYDNSLPPALSNQKMNAYLKEVAQLLPSLNESFSKNYTKAGMNITTKRNRYELITTHTARRSFATNLYKDGVPSYTIMQITGHKTEKAFLSYIKVTPDEHAKLLQLHWASKHKLKAI